MRFSQNIKVVLAVMATALIAVSCIKEESVPNKEREKISLEAWIRLNKPELLDNSPLRVIQIVPLISRPVICV